MWDVKNPHWLDQWSANRGSLATWVLHCHKSISTTCGWAGHRSGWRSAGGCGVCDTEEAHATNAQVERERASHGLSISVYCGQCLACRKVSRERREYLLGALSYLYLSTSCRSHRYFWHQFNKLL
jgi:hypothetical protein